MVNDINDNIDETTPLNIDKKDKYSGVFPEHGPIDEKNGKEILE